MRRRGLGARASDSRMAKKPARRRQQRPAAPLPLPSAHAPAPEFTIVGVGASAGGFEAFAQLLEGLPAKPNIALIFVQHLAPHHSSSLASLLAGHTPLPVVEATEGARIVANRVYVVPPNAQMELVDGHLHLGRRPEDRTPVQPHRFFFSIARALAAGTCHRRRAVGHRIGRRTRDSRNQDDGGDHVRAGSRHGQIRRHAARRNCDANGRRRRLSGRDRSQGRADLDSIRISRRRLNPIADRRSPTSSSGASFNCCCRPAASISRTTRRRRSSAACSAAWRCSAWSMSTRTSSTSSRRRRRWSTFITTYSSTSHDSSANPNRFEIIAKDVLGTVDVSSSAPLRIWVAGCATGEEVYSLAIVVREVLGDTLEEGRVQIFGTDVSESAVNFARHGLYAASIADDVSPERLRRFFAKTDGGYQVTKTVRDMCVFARQDLTRDPPFSHLDLICCRNVLIYMDSALQRKLLSMFHYALKLGGFLVLGHAESIGYHSDLFAPMNKKHKIYRKKAGAATAPLMDVFRPTFKVGIRRFAGARIAERDQARVERRDPHHHGAVRAAERAARSAVSRRAVQRPDRTVPRAVTWRAELRHSEARARRDCRTDFAPRSKRRARRGSR